MNKFLFKKIKFFISSLGYKKINIISEIKEVEIVKYIN